MSSPSKLFTLSFLLAFAASALAQPTGGLRGRVLDPAGAVVPGAVVALARGRKILTTNSGSDGSYSFPAVPAGGYTLTVHAKDFAPYLQRNVFIVGGHSQSIDVSLSIAVQNQKIAVNGQSPGLSVNPNQNASALVITGSALDALSDDPDALKDELEALAGPAAGPNGGEIYVDGFAADQLPPKSSIREIRINQDPFSAEYARLGYGRIEILTKPGSDKFSGQIASRGNDSALDTANALIQKQPSYYFYDVEANVNGPLSGAASYFLDGSWTDVQDQGIVDAINPSDTASTIQISSPLPIHTLQIDPRFDFQLGKNNTLTIRDAFYRKTEDGAGVGALNLPMQAYNVDNEENAIQAANTTVVNSHLLTETRFQWQRVRSAQIANFFTPTITTTGAFTDGGNNSGAIEDHQDDFDLQNESITTFGAHTIHFGARARVYRDANYSTAGENGNYYFYSIANYVAKAPDQYQATVINQPLVRAVLFDGALFYQDDWRWKPNPNLSYGLRFEGQNRIHDHADWAPRIAMAWAPKRTQKAPKTVIRGGYGWFYNRFTVPNSFSLHGQTPYIMQAIHDNQVNQQSYVVNDPAFYDPTTAVPPGDLNTVSAAIPYYYTVDPHFHAALDMQAAIGVDQKLGKRMTANLTYLYTRGVHQYLTNNISAPAFDPSTYTITGPQPSIYNYQFQSGAVYKQDELVATVAWQFHRFEFNGFYNLNFAKSDTQGVHYFPSVSADPGLDYGPARFGYRSFLTFLSTYKLPYKIIFTTFVVARSGVPYNVTIGSDLTGNNQNNARPTYGACGAPDVIATKYGCLDTNPVGKGEKIVPYGIGVGPANTILDLMVSKVIGMGPQVEGLRGAPGLAGGNGSVSDHGLGGGQHIADINAKLPRKYTLTLAAVAMNALNIVNLGTPNGVLDSSLFGESQSLANGQFSIPTPGNRSIVVKATFTF